MRKPPSKVCIGNYGTVLDVIHFMGLGTGKRETRSTSYFIATVPGFFEKFYGIEFRKPFEFRRNSISFRTKYRRGAPENENTPHFREIPSVAPEVFHFIRVGGGAPLFRTYENSQEVT